MPVIVAPCLQATTAERGFAGSPPPRGEEIHRLRPLPPMAGQPLSRRLERLPPAIVLGREVPVAAGFRARLLGLAHLDRDEAGPGLLIPRCSGVHTFGMRFALDLVFLDRGGRPCSVRREVRPRRFASDRRAAAVLELPLLEGHAVPQAKHRRCD